MRKILSDREVTSVRIVVNPDDYNVDAIVVNRVIPDYVTDDYFKVWKDIQKKYCDMINESFAPLPIFQAPLFESEIVGLGMLAKMGEVIFGDRDAAEIFYNKRTQRVEKKDNGYLLSIYMPFTEKGYLSLNQKGDELIVKVGNVKRNITLPKTLLSCAIKGAKFEDQILKARFGGADR